MRWTPYLDECLDLLETSKDFPTDLLLVHLVRVQLICNKATLQNLNTIVGDSNSQLPVEFYTKTLKSELDGVERSIPQELKENGMHLVIFGQRLNNSELTQDSSA